MIMIFVVSDSYMLYAYLLSIFMVLYEVIYHISLIMIWMEFANHVCQILQDEHDAEL